MRSVIILGITLFLIVNFCMAQDQTGLRYPADPAQQKHPEIPKGEIIQLKFINSKIFPGTERTYWIYVPAGYKPDKPACLYVDMDGIQFNAPQIFDYLIYKGEMPVTIGVFISSGATVNDGKNVVRYNRSHEFDSLNDDFVNFLLTELLPDAERQKTADGRAIVFSKDANDHAIAGASSGAICAFTAAWQRPDVFSRVFSTIGTYIGMRGGDQYPILVRKTEPKLIRIFLQDNSNDAWNPLFGSWFTSNLNMEAALNFSGYEVTHTWGSGGHSTEQADAIFPDVMRWLWKGWPQRVQAGKSNNNMLNTILTDGETWQDVPGSFQSASNLISASKGDVLIQDADGTIRSLDRKTYSTISKSSKNNIIAPGADGKSYILDKKLKQLIEVTLAGKRTVITKNIIGDKLIATDKGNIYVIKHAPSEAETGEIILVKPDGSTIIVDSGLHFASAITTSADHKMLLVAENNTNWIYNYVIQSDGTLQYKQKWYWLHQTDNGGYSVTNDIAMDNQGNLYAATNAGIQICDQNGRVRAILQPPGSGTTTSLCFGGENCDTLFAVRNGKLYKRKLKVNGVLPWMAPVFPQSIGAG
jgi:gluconolactonase